MVCMLGFSYPYAKNLRPKCPKRMMTYFGKEHFNTFACINLVSKIKLQLGFRVIQVQTFMVFPMVGTPGLYL